MRSFARARITTAFSAGEMAGLSPAEAEAVLAKDPAVAGARVEITPGWLIKTVPENPDRVVFEDAG